jgi:hypothetical protein
MDTNGSISRPNTIGWEASVSGNFNRYFAVEFSANGYYKSLNVADYIPVADLQTLGISPTLNIAIRDYSYLAGPRFNYGPVFGHALLGANSLSGSALGNSVSETGFAGAFGGGIQIPLNNRYSFRAGADYVFSRYNIVVFSWTQNNFRVSAGIVINIGKR